MYSYMGLDIMTIDTNVYLDSKLLTDEQSKELAELILTGQFPEKDDEYEELEVVENNGESNS